MKHLSYISFFVIALLLTGFIGPDPRVHPPLLVGVWAGKTDEYGVSGNEWRSWKAVHRPDGSFILHHRTYDGERLLHESTEYGEWWMQGDLMYESFDSIESEGVKKPLDIVETYRVIEVKNGRMEYEHVKSGHTYSATAVSESSDF